MIAVKDKLWNKNYKKVMTINFLIHFSFHLIVPLLPLYLNEHFHASKDMIGIALSGYTVVCLLFRMLSGYLVDSFDRRKILLLALFFLFTFFAGYVIVSSVLLFVLIRTIHGAPFGGATVAVSTLAIDVLPSSRRNEGIGYFGLSNNIAMAIAPTVGIFLYNYLNDFNILFWFSFVAAGIGLLVSYSLKPPKREIIKREKIELSLDRFFLKKGVWIGINIMFFGFCFGVLQNYLAIYGKEQFNITTGTGTYFMILSIGLMVSRLYGARSMRAGKISGNAVEGVLISSIGYSLFILMPNSIGFYGSALLIGLGNGHMYPAFQSMIVGVANNNERGTAISTLLVSWDLGAGLGVLLGGVVAEYTNFTVAFIVVALAQIAGAVFFILKTRTHWLKNKPQNLS